MKKTILGLVLMSTFIGCNEQKKSVSEPRASEIKVEKQEVKRVSLAIEMNSDTVEEIDVRFLGFKINDTQNGNYTIIQEINEANVFIENEYLATINSKPRSIQIGLGNKLEKNISIKALTLKYDENVIEMKGTDIIKYFNSNKFVTIDSTGLVSTKKRDGKHIPMLILSPQIIKELYK